MMQNIILGLIGMASGVIVAGGTGALLTSVGVLTRLAFHSKTEQKVHHYENCVILGVVIGTVASVYVPNIQVFGHTDWMPSIIVGVIGCCMGIFVGCLAMALSEALDVSTIFFRRLNIKNYLWMIMLAAAIGKFFGNLVYFFA